MLLEPDFGSPTITKKIEFYPLLNHFIKQFSADRVYGWKCDSVCSTHLGVDFPLWMGATCPLAPGVADAVASNHPLDVRGHPL